MNFIYEPEEDSYLMQEALEKNLKKKEIRILEIGIGSGIQLQTLKKLGIKNIFGVDINPKAVDHCKKLGFNCIQSDLFSKINGKIRSDPKSKEGLIKGNFSSPYDLIIFNPPYLPKDSKEPTDSQIATTGGKKGSEIINKFLKQAKKYLTPKGKIFLLVSSLTKGVNYRGYNKKIISKKKIFFEELTLLSLRPLHDKGKLLHSKNI